MTSVTRIGSGSFGVGSCDRMMLSVQPVAPHLRVRANKLILLQILQRWSQVIPDPCCKYQRESFVKLMPCQLSLCKGSLKNSGCEVSGTVSDPQLTAHGR
jgi:hypothetical protein